MEVGCANEIELVFFVKYPADLAGSLDHSLNMKPAVAQWSKKISSILRRQFNNVFVNANVFPPNFT